MLEVDQFRHMKGYQQLVKFDHLLADIEEIDLTKLKLIKPIMANCSFPKRLVEMSSAHQGVGVSARGQVTGGDEESFGHKTFGHVSTQSRKQKKRDFDYSFDTKTSK
ncbi:hypothetical protein CDAR_522631 [Caerostris darwini]|uniref:Uncharacterized protein n=1 Tax=Caerostris darwini TaxID=1538125 RepID=A0AAV4U9B9_9ARAC|nr:hypothetical protein CDAR_522631 [Caerostris darwini]